MVSVPWPTIIEQVRDIIDSAIRAAKAREGRRSARNVSELFFWQDGMLGSLQNLASGNRSPEIFAELERNFEQSDEHVMQIIESLREARSRLAAVPETFEIARKLDRIVWSPLGKIGIRTEIRRILDNRASDQVMEVAARTCAMIQEFNANVEELHRLVAAR
jgi:hypothetical protein